MKHFILAIFCIYSLAQADDIYFYNNGKKIKLKENLKELSLKSTEDNETKESFKIEGTKKSINVGKKVMFKAKDKEAFNKILKKYKAKKMYGDIYIIEAKNPRQAIKISNELYENNLTSFAEPVLEKEVKWK